MKLNTKALRYLTAEDWRVLTAVEMGSKNHELVPTAMIGQIAGLRGGSAVHKSISALAKVDLIAKIKNAKYDGYRLTYGGIDYLALNAHRKSSTIFSLGNQIGVGKESDIYVVASESGRQMVLKIHRLGRISFRTVKANRDYLRNRSGGSWMYLSRLAATKEYAFLQALWKEGFPVPEPIAQNRHTVVMDLIESFPLRQIDSVPEPAELYADLMELIVRFAQVGLIHGDFNEFNILIKEKRRADGSIKLEPIVIDFPQMLSITHVNAEMYFDRDVNCIKIFFERQFKFVADDKGPFFADAIKGSEMNRRLDVEVEATGFSKKLAKDLDNYIDDMGRKLEQDRDSELDGEENGEETGEEDEEKDTDSDDAGEDDFNSFREDVSDQVYAEHDTRFNPIDLPDDAELPIQVQQLSVNDNKKKSAGWAI